MEAYFQSSTMSKKSLEVSLVLALVVVLLKYMTKLLRVEDAKLLCTLKIIQKISKSTSGRQDNGYLRIIDPIHGPPGGAPTSKRIIENINKCIGKHLLDIIAAQGAIVPGLGSHHDHRRIPGIKIRGGTQVKLVYTLVAKFIPILNKLGNICCGGIRPMGGKGSTTE
ncbi:hypothetical protein BB558_000978 [Smittium angustum]|uniref:Uncharacterized protein n=1 Tax=Smittium angustum TaxID=133377 RepID=A0A2U1JCW7_SMIAN|nr:hypothetical protein BB558_000978 [Smittium angustum]